MKNWEIHKEYCQSCGMPLRFDVEKYLGTNADLSASDEYCYYCLKEGEYTVDIPLDEMVNIWVKYTDKYNDYSDTNYTPKELEAVLYKRLPTLKRWKQKLITENIHYESIEKIKTHIDKNLDKDIDMEELCSIGNLSFFHLRRVFKNITGENIGSYIQRLRLENVAHKLATTDLPINYILEETCYQTKSSLAKEFKKHFGIPMSVYRKRYRFISTEKELNVLHPEIKKLGKQNVICYPVGETFRNKEEYLTLWKKIIHYQKKHIKSENAGPFVCLSLDNPVVTPMQQCRFYVGILTSEESKPNGKFCLQEIPEGFYALFKHKGNYTSLPDLYRAVYEQWLPQSGYIQKNTMSFEVYLNSPKDTDASELLTEIYIPIEKP